VYIYGFSLSETIVGCAIVEFTRRDDIVLAIKVPAHARQTQWIGLSRKAIGEPRLATDCIDLYQVHRTDPETPVGRRSMHCGDVVKAGKAGYLGASSIYAWKFATMRRSAA
jgi:1-deoxyxylulose-5-phosphate synthase